MARFNYIKALENRLRYPYLGNAVYFEDGQLLRGDIWINKVLNELPDTVLIVAPVVFLTAQCCEKDRKRLFENIM